MQSEKQFQSVQMIFFRQGEVLKTQEIFEEQNSISQSKIHIKLSQWQLHAVGGFHWIFKWKNNDHENNISKQWYQKYFNDKYLMRVTPNRYIREVLKDRKSYFVDLIEYTRRKTQGKIGTEPSPQSQDYFDQKDKTQKQDQIDRIIQIIYSQFLQEIRKPFNVDLLNSSDDKHSDEQVIFSSLTHGILEQSQKYFCLPSLQKSVFHEQNYKKIQAFLSVNLKKILQLQLRNLTQNETEQIRSHFNQIQVCVKDHLIEHPINYRKVYSSINGVNFYVTFEQNLTSQKSFPTNFLKDLCSYTDSQSIVKTQLKCVYQLFEVKPKTVLPDMFSESLIEEFVNQYQRIFYKYGQKHAKLQQFSEIKWKFRPKDQKKIKPCVTKEALIDIIQRSNLSYKKQSNQGNSLIEQIKSQMSLLSLEFNIESTRWFKKNCLAYKTKKKHENPLIFFKSCFIPKYLQNTQKQEKIDFYRPKHLKGRTQFTIYPGKQQGENVQKMNQRPQSYNYDQNNPNHLKSQNQKSNQILSVQEHILKEIEWKRYSLKLNKKCLGPGSKTRAQISLIDEILALQMMNCACLQEQTETQRKEPTKPQSIQQECYTVTQLRDKLIELQSLMKANYGKRQNQKIKRVSHTNAQRLYPSSILKSLKNIIEPNVYEKAVIFRQLLKKIIFSSPNVQSGIIKCLQTSTMHLHLLQLEKQHILLPIKTHLFNIVLFLITLTWRDISLMIQSVRAPQNKSDPKLSISPQKRCLFLRFIDVQIKPVKSIQTNIQKDKQFLFYYGEYQKIKKFQRLIGDQEFNQKPGNNENQASKEIALI